MTRRNVELVASIYEAFARRDNASPFDVYATDIEWDQSRAFTEGRTSVYRGHDGIRESFRSLLSAFSTIEFKVEDITEVGGRVVASVHEHYVGRASGVEVDRRHYTVWTIQAGKVTRMRAFLDRDEALEAARRSD
jgi:ketosteroid isomerase-like protein